MKRFALALAACAALPGCRPTPPAAPEPDSGPPRLIQLADLTDAEKRFGRRSENPGLERVRNRRRVHEPRFEFVGARRARHSSGTHDGLGYAMKLDAAVSGIEEIEPI